MRIGMLKRSNNNGIFILTQAKATTDIWHWRIKNRLHILPVYVVNTVIKYCEEKKSEKQDEWKNLFSSNGGRKTTEVATVTM